MNDHIRKFGSPFSFLDACQDFPAAILLWNNEYHTLKDEENKFNESEAQQIFNFVKNSH